MKITQKSLLTCLALVVIFSGTSMIRVAAQDAAMTSQQIDRILGNCVSAKNTLNQLHASDALLRVNRGQVYELISTKLMDGFNDRISNNKLDNKELVDATSGYNTALNTFRADYKTYEEHLSLAIGIDCQKQPVSFYDSVTSARNERNRVHADILKLNQHIDQYQAAINKFEKEYTAANVGAGK